MSVMIINISQEYTKTPGGRYCKDGDFSGEDFRKKLLIPRFRECIQKGEKLRVVLDGGYGYGSSFLEEAFGGLVRDTKDVRARNIEIISDEEPKLIEDIKRYINDAIDELRL